MKHSITHTHQRVALFIDTQNLYHSARHLFGAKVNFESIMQIAQDNRSLVRARAYAITTESQEEQAFIEALENAGIETKTKELQIFSSGAKKADWDVGMAIDAVSMSKKVDVVMLVTGDGDFIPLVEYLQMQGCYVELVSFGRSTSGGLIEVVDHFIDMDMHPEIFLLRNYKNMRKKLKASK